MPSASNILGSFSIDDGNGSENVSVKMNSRFFQALSRLFHFAENGKCRQISLELIRKRKIEEKVRSFALREDEAIWKAIDCQQGEAKRSYHGFVTVVISRSLSLFFF